MISALDVKQGLVNYPFLLAQAPFAGLFGVCIACVAGIASNTGNTYTFVRAAGASVQIIHKYWMSSF
ncbi:MAG TPA: hypothetical protein VN729_10260 [Ktedonobacteraceae bacterium]|nr:hypothetical protein [Ktedonobacteraceae bacterium]